MNNILNHPAAGNAPVVNPKRRGIKARQVEWLGRQAQRRQQQEEARRRASVTVANALEQALNEPGVAQEILSQQLESFLHQRLCKLTPAECLRVYKAFTDRLQGGAPAA